MTKSVERLSAGISLSTIGLCRGYEFVSVKFIAIACAILRLTLVRRDQVFFVGVDNKHSQQACGLSVTGICTDDVMIARYFGPALAGVIHLFRTDH
jgi:hypothetical protein